MTGREARAAIDLRRLAPLLAQLALLLGVYWVFNIESPEFFRLAVCTYVGFLIHYFVPFRWKKQAFILISLVGAVILLKLPAEQMRYPVLGYAMPMLLVGIVLVLAIVFFVVLSLPIRFYLRVAIVVAIGCMLAYARSEIVFLPGTYWTIIGAVFMFRMILYTYEVAVGRAPERLLDCLSYFCLLPNFYFTLFPVIDYKTFKDGFYAADIHENVQRGIAWMIRGATHLMLYRLIYHRVVISPFEVDSFWTMWQYIVPTYLLYLRVSGLFHMIVGMLHLFGYRLPEINRYWLLASSFTDFWRRINIYWKDFMIKAFYYPVYFRFRRKNETLALIIATIVVFTATVILHSYQLFWLQGSFIITTTDVIFWSTLGALVLINVLWETKRGRPRQRSKAAAMTIRVLCTIAIYLTITILWSIWSSPSLSVWLDTISYWAVTP